MFTLKWANFKYSRTQMGLWRIAFGAYLTFYFVRVLPYLRELFSNEGPYRNLVEYAAPRSLVPQWILAFDSVEQVNVMAIACIIFAAMIMIGFKRNWAALCLWLLTIWFYNRNPSTNSPEYEFINWLVFALIFIPTGERFAFGRKNLEWAMPAGFYWGGWIVLAVGYFYSGTQKFAHHDPSWIDGSAMYIILSRNSSRFDWYGGFFDHVPMIFFRLMTWTALCTQTLAGIFIYFRRVRPWWWLSATLVHLALLCLVNLTQLTLGMIMFQLFLFDLQWAEQLHQWWRVLRPASRTRKNFVVHS